MCYYGQISQLGLVFFNLLKGEVVMEIGEVSAQQGFRPGSQVIVRMDGGVTVEGIVESTISPRDPKRDEPFCVVRVPVPVSQLRRP